VVSFTSRSLHPGEEAPGTHFIGGWLGPRTGLKAAVKRNRSCRESEPCRQARRSLTMLNELFPLRMKNFSFGTKTFGVAARCTQLPAHWVPENLSRVAKRPKHEDRHPSGNCKFVPMLKSSPCNDMYWGSRSLAPRIFDLETRRR